MFLTNFFSKIGDVFTNMFNSAHKTWEKLSPEIQNGMLHGSGIIATINKYVDAAPQFVIDAVVAKYPGLHIDQVTAGLKKVAVVLNVGEGINDADLVTTVSRLQAYFAAQKNDGKIWAIISHSAAAVLAVVLAPADAKVAAVTSLLEFVYQHFIKPDNAAPVEVPVETPAATEQPAAQPVAEQPAATPETVAAAAVVETAIASTV